MITKYLKGSIEDIENLIKLTRLDIKNIKAAKHNELQISASLKEELIASFENKKSLLNSELIRLTEKNSGKTLNDLLSKKEKELLESFKKNLSKLKRVNRDYAKYVATISEFYNSFCTAIFNQEPHGYHKANPTPASFLKISA